MALSMQMKALRSANFAKLSSSSSTSEAYWVVSISAGTPGGYCLSQTRSMVFPPNPVRLLPQDGLFGPTLVHAAAHGKRARRPAAGRNRGRFAASGAVGEEIGRRQPAGLLSLRFGLAAVLGAGFAAPAAAAGLAAASGLALACLIAGLASAGFASVEPASCFAATRARLPRRPVAR